jgi:predicted transcriptional regulator
MLYRKTPKKNNNMNDIKEWKEKTLRYIKQEGNTRPVSFYELNNQIPGNSNILSVLQELVAEDFMCVFIM